MINWLKSLFTKSNDSDFKDQIKSNILISQRIIALIAIISKVHQGNSDGLVSWVNDDNISNFFSEDEKKFFNETEPNQESLEFFSWKAEATVSLLWALNKIDIFPNLHEQYDIFELPIIKEIIDSPNNFIQTSVLRNEKEIREKELDLIHQHHRVRFNSGNLFESDNDIPREQLNYNIVYERRYGLSWIVDVNEKWDSVSTDT